MTSRESLLTGKFTIPDETILATVAAREHPIDFMDLVIDAAARHDIAYEVLYQVETVRQKWGRAIHLSRLESSLKRLTAAGVLIVHTGSEWRRFRNGRRWVPEPKTRYWSDPALLASWIAEDATDVAQVDAAKAMLTQLQAAASDLGFRLARREPVPVDVSFAALGERVDSALVELRAARAV